MLWSDGIAYAPFFPLGALRRWGNPPRLMLHEAQCDTNAGALAWLATFTEYLY